MSSFRTHFFTQLLNTDNHENLVKIIKTTYLRNENRINNKKKISDKDDKYFNLAEKYLYNELSISLNETIENIKEYIFKIVNKKTNLFFGWSFYNIITIIFINS